MHRVEETQVLIVGAGPVGLLAGLLLAEGGVQVKIVDQAIRTATRSYACALHPGTLQLLDKLGLAGQLLEVGHRIDKIALYEGAKRRAEVNLADLEAEHPYILILPQTALEDLLEQELLDRARVRVQWSHRFSDLQRQGASVLASVDKLVETAKGYIVPEWQWVVDKTLSIRADFLLGADGPNSHVRQLLGIDTDGAGEPEFFAVYEFDSDDKHAGEVSLVLDEKDSNVFWPLSGRKCRWSFQIAEADVSIKFPDKDTMAVRVEEAEVDQANRKHLEEFLRDRAPWFEGKIGLLQWSTVVRFAHRVAQRFGQGRCWLIGDAAHQTSPVGVQSMNVGMHEAEALAAILIKILKEKASLKLLDSYQNARRAEWEQLLGLKGNLKASPGASAWMKRHGAQILPCLPAGGQDLADLLEQLGLQLA